MVHFLDRKKKILSNISKALPEIGEKNTELIVKKMWENYGRILSEYMFIKNFRNSKYKKFLTIEGQEILDELKDSNNFLVPLPPFLICFRQMYLVLIFSIILLRKILFRGL